MYIHTVQHKMDEGQKKMTFTTWSKRGFLDN